MALLLFHPGPAAIDCHDCQCWHYDLEKGKRLKIEHRYHKIEQFTPKSKPLIQCGDCPKKSPENAEKLKLTKENREVLELFMECRAMHWQGTPEAVSTDRVLRSRFAKLEQLFASHDRQRQAMTITNAVIAASGGKHG